MVNHPNRSRAVSRHFPSGRFAYALGYKSRQAAQDAFDSLCAEGEMSPGEGRIEPYNASGLSNRAITRYAITIAS